ncbi:MAG: metal ABC transporter permease, partial [Pseudomonadota bacterium]
TYQGQGMTFYQTILSKLPFDWAQYAFMHHALVAVLILAPLLAFIGTVVINNQMTFFSETIGHATLAGVAIAVLLGVENPLVVVILFSLLLALFITLVRRLSPLGSDTTLGITMSFAVALGVAILSRGGGFSKYQSYLIGDILTVTPQDNFGMFFLFLLVFALGGYFYNAILLFSLHPTLARTRGIKVFFLEITMMMLIATVVAVALPKVGLLVINALIILPAACAKNIAGNIPSYLFWAIFIGLLTSVSGLIASYYGNVASGAAMVLCQMVVFLVSLLCKRQISGALHQ